MEDNDVSLCQQIDIAPIKAIMRDQKVNQSSMVDD